MWDTMGDCQIIEKVRILPPHEVIDSLIGTCDQRLHEYSCLDTSAKQHLRGDLEDWATRVGTDLADHVWLMLALWGDSAPMSRNTSLFLLTFRILSGVHAQRYWVAAITKKICNCGCAGRCTFDRLWEVVAWSCRVMISGVWPTHDHAGRLLVGWRADLARTGTPFAWRAAVVAKCGDWAWHKQVLGMRGWADSLNCWLCQAELGNKEFGLGASWRQTSVSMSAFNAQLLMDDTWVSSIFTIPGFSLAYVKPDFMHCICLGILGYLEGNVMWELFRQVGGSYSNPRAACATLMNIIKVYSKKLGLEVPFGALTVRMIKATPSKKPRMRLKAGEARYFLPVLTAMLTDAFPVVSPVEQLRLDCCRAMCRMYAVLRRWSPDESPGDLERYCRQHLLLYRTLHDMQPEGSLQWWIYPKHHMSMHVCMTRVNPADLWNYMDEDEIGRAAALAKHSNEAHLHTALIERYRLHFEREL